MSRLDSLTPRRIRLISLALIVMAVVALVLWLAPVFSGESNIEEAWPAFIWAMAFGIVILLLNYVETRRQILLRRTYVSRTHFFNGFTSTPYGSLFELVECMIISNANLEVVSEGIADCNPDDFVLAVDSQVFEFDRTVGVQNQGETNGRKLSSMLSASPSTNSMSISIIRWKGTVTVFAHDDQPERSFPFADTDELEILLANALALNLR